MFLYFFAGYIDASLQYFQLKKLCVNTVKGIGGGR